MAGEKRRRHGLEGFDPDFDDARAAAECLDMGVVQVDPMVHPAGYRIERRIIRQASVFGRNYHLGRPLECRFLYTGEGQLWMSDVPQERFMMYNNACLSRGHALVGGLGLGLYPQYAARGAAGDVTRFTIVEQNPLISSLVWQKIRLVLPVAARLIIRGIEAFLEAEHDDCYDTIFIDTWANLDPVELPYVNRLRDLALARLSRNGRLLLWGYRWMVRLFEDGCRRLLSLHPGRRAAWLSRRETDSPRSVALLLPVADHFAGRTVEDMQEALLWCRGYIVRTVENSCDGTDGAN